MAEDHYYSGDGVLAKPQNTTNSPTDTEFLEGDPTTLTRSRRERALDKLNKLKLGMGGNKARRGSTPRTSLVGAPTVLVGGGGGGGERNGTTTRAIKTNGTGVTSPSYGEATSIGTRSMEQLNERLQRLKADATRSGSRVAADAQSTPFRVKFVNSKGEATMADVYPNEDFKDIVQQVTEKLRMSRRSDYVLMYRDTDDEEIGVACTDNLREMFSLFEPGSRLQLRIVPFNIINSGALDTIANIWEYSQTPNIFISSGAATPAGEEDGDDVASDASTNNDLDLSKIEIENLKHENEQKPEMAEKPKPSGSAIEDITDAAVAAAAASSAAAAAIAASKADEAAAAAANAATAADSPPSSTQTQAASSPKPEASPDNGGKASDAEGLRQAITMMGANLALAIDSLGTKLTRNFDQLSTEQGKILGVLKAASEKPEPAAVVVTEITVEENDEEEKKKQQQQQEAEEAEKKKKQQQEEAEAEKKKEEEAKRKKEEEEEAEKEKEKKKKEEQDEVEAEIRKAHEEEERLLREEEEKLLQEEMQLLEEEAKLLREREEEKQKQEEAAKKKEERKKLDEEAKKKMDEERKKIEEDRKRVEEVRKRIEDERKKMEEERMQKLKEEEIENIKITVVEEKPAAAEEAKKKKGEVKFAVENSRDSDEETINVEIFDETRSDISNHSSTSAGSGRTKMSETIDVKVTESAGAATHTESIKVHVEEPAHRPAAAPAAAAAPAPSHAPDATKAFAYHLSAANFAFHSNPYSSSFFKHGFAEADMPSHFSHPCMMASPFECVSSCSCTRGNSCPACTHVNTH
ncbi:hypothetical protein LPJ72_005591 [Coemansia sp. Benny D160-2]|nr:hypothetical protein LPJ72_005591 [Coemansia sp. Benny D160-2]